jgi:pimeloyl-ACP methyl ester carboxylesterase
MGVGGLNESILLPDDVLRAIRTPFLFLWGGDDVMGAADVARAFVPRVPNATLEIVPGAGHAVWMDDVDAIAMRTAEFLGA